MALPFSPCGRRWREAPDEGFSPRIQNRAIHSRTEPLTRLAASRRATLSHKGRGESTPARYLLFPASPLLFIKILGSTLAGSNHLCSKIAPQPAASSAELEESA